MKWLIDMVMDQIEEGKPLWKKLPPGLNGFNLLRKTSKLVFLLIQFIKTSNIFLKFNVG